MSNSQKLQTKDKELVPEWYIAKRIIRSKGFTYGQLAEKLGVSVTTIYDLCNFPPNVVRVKQLADAIGCSFFNFFDFSRSVCGDGIATAEKKATVPDGSPSGRPVSGDTVAAETPQSGFTCPHCGQPLFLTTVPE